MVSSYLKLNQLKPRISCDIFFLENPGFHLKQFLKCTTSHLSDPVSFFSELDKFFAVKIYVSYLFCAVLRTFTGPITNTLPFR